MHKYDNPFKPNDKVRCINCRGNEYLLKRGDIYTVFKTEGRYIVLEEIKSFFLVEKFELVKEYIENCVCENSTDNDDGETVFQNSEEKWFLKSLFDEDECIGLKEFAYTEIRYCPFCGKKL